jgi:hypothetical protein
VAAETEREGIALRRVGTARRSDAGRDSTARRAAMMVAGGRGREVAVLRDEVGGPDVVAVVLASVLALVVRVRFFFLASTASRSPSLVAGFLGGAKCGLEVGPDS